MVKRRKLSDLRGIQLGLNWVGSRNTPIAIGPSRAARPRPGQLACEFESASRAHILTPQRSAPPSLSLPIFQLPPSVSAKCSISILSRPSTRPTYRITTLYSASRQCRQQQIPSHHHTAAAALSLHHHHHNRSHLENSLLTIRRFPRHPPPLLSLQVLASLSIRLRTRIRPRALLLVSASVSSSSSVSVGSSFFAGASGCVVL
jgi:hypothetical protein